MATAEAVAEIDDKQAQDAFDSGFDPTTDKAVVERPVAEATPEPAAEAAPEAVVEAPAAEEPKYVQITEETLNRLLAAADETVGLKGQVSKAFGTIGNVKQVVDRLQSQTQAGAAVEISDEVLAEAFADMEQDFETLAGQNRKAIKHVLSKLNLRGTGTAAAAPDPDEFRKIAREERLQEEAESLGGAYPEWATIVGRKPDDAPEDWQPDPKNEFRAWLAGQKDAYQALVNNTKSPRVIEQALDRFHAQPKKPPPAPKPPAPNGAARQDRLRAAVPAKGDGPAPKPVKTAEDYLAEGFNTG